jgi:hypothetical protein
MLVDPPASHRSSGLGAATKDLLIVKEQFGHCAITASGYIHTENARVLEALRDHPGDLTLQGGGVEAGRRFWAPATATVHCQQGIFEEERKTGG